MYNILSAVSRLVAPIISFTAEEIWKYMPHRSCDDKESVFLNQMPEKSGLSFAPEFVSKWELIYNIREAANKVLEEKRTKSLSANLLKPILLSTATARCSTHMLHLPANLRIFS